MFGQQTRGLTYSIRHFANGATVSCGWLNFLWDKLPIFRKIVQSRISLGLEDIGQAFLEEIRVFRFGAQEVRADFLVRLVVGGISTMIYRHCAFKISVECLIDSLLNSAKHLSWISRGWEKICDVLLAGHPDIHIRRAGHGTDWAIINLIRSSMMLLYMPFFLHELSAPACSHRQPTWWKLQIDVQSAVKTEHLQ